MRVRLYLKDDQRFFDILEVIKKAESELIEFQFASSLNLQWDAEGAYVECSHFMFGVPNSITHLDLSVRRVEILEIFPSNLGSKPAFTMPQGVYEEGENTGTVDYFMKDRCHMASLRVIASGITGAESLFSQIRGGKIRPVSPWHDAPQEDAHEAPASQ